MFFSAVDGSETISSVDVSMEAKMVELPKHISSGNSVVRTENQSHGRHISEECQPAQCPTVLLSRVSPAAPELGQRSSYTSTKVMQAPGRTNKVKCIVYHKISDYILELSFNISSRRHGSCQGQLFMV